MALENTSVNTVSIFQRSTLAKTISTEKASKDHRFTWRWMSFEDGRTLIKQIMLKYPLQWQLSQQIIKAYLPTARQKVYVSSTIKIQEHLASCPVFRPQLLQASEAFNLVSPIAQPETFSCQSHRYLPFYLF